MNMIRDKDIQIDGRGRSSVFVLFIAIINDVIAVQILSVRGGVCVRNRYMLREDRIN